MAWAMRGDQSPALSGIEQIGGEGRVPPRYGDHPVPSAFERSARMAANEPGRTRQQHRAQGAKSGSDASRVAITSGSSGQTMPKAGSFQRTARKSSGSNGVSIW